MARTLLGLCIVFIGYALASGLTSPSQPAFQTCLAITEGTESLGELRAGSEFTHTVKLKNIGTRSLLISRLAASCDCTDVSTKSLAIEPGVTRQLSLRVKTDSKLDWVSPRKDFTVELNATLDDGYVMRFPLSGKISQPLRIDKQELAFNEALPHDGTKAQCALSVLRPDLEGVFEINLVGPFDYDGSPDKGNPLRYNIAVRPRNSFQAGDFGGTLELTLSKPSQARSSQPSSTVCRVPIRARIDCDVEHHPATIYCTGAGRTDAQRLHLTSRSGPLPVILAADSPAADLQIDVHDADILIALQPDSASVGRVLSTVMNVTVKSDLYAGPLRFGIPVVCDIKSAEK